MGESGDGAERLCSSAAKCEDAPPQKKNQGGGRYVLSFVRRARIIASYLHRQSGMHMSQCHA